MHNSRALSLSTSLQACFMYELKTHSEQGQIEELSLNSETTSLKTFSNYAKSKGRV